MHGLTQGADAHQEPQPTSLGVRRNIIPVDSRQDLKDVGRRALDRLATPEILEQITHGCGDGWLNRNSWLARIQVGEQGSTELTGSADTCELARFPR
jgi:hypothetical protein